MPINLLHTFIKKRKLLYGTNDKAAFIKSGEEYLENKQIDDALDFFERAKYEEGFQKIIEIAIAEGNLYLYQKICKIRRKDADKDTIIEIGKKAMELEKYSFAYDAFKLVDHKGLIEEVEKKMGIGEEAESEDVE